MYDQLFTKYWVLDRCFEGSFYGFYLMSIISIIVFILGLVIFIKTFHKLSIDLFFEVVIDLLFIITFSIIVFIGSIILWTVTGHVLLGCSFQTFFDPIDAGHKINAELKEKLKYHQVPATWQEVCQIKPAECEIIEKNSKYQYFYDQKSERYILFIRPSRYGLAVFDPNINFGIYAFPGKALSNDFPDYPPPAAGPWDQFPR